MKPTRQIHDPHHNPFHNRFHVPTHARLDEMQAYTHMIWLNEPAALDDETKNKHHSRHWGRALAARLRARAGGGILCEVSVELSFV